MRKNLNCLAISVDETPGDRQIDNSVLIIDLVFTFLWKPKKLVMLNNKLMLTFPSSLILTVT